MIKPRRIERRPGDQRGFTLVELLVAMTVMSLVAFVTLGGLKFGARVSQRAEADSDNGESIETVQRFLRRQMSSIYPAWQDVGDGLGRVQFDGGQRGLSFVAPPPVQLGRSQNQVYELILSTAGNLDLRWRPADASTQTQAIQETLLHHVNSIELSYFGPDVTGRTPQWTGVWNDRTRLPSLIKMKVSFASGDRRQWPELIVHPRISVDAACVYDAVSRGCRGRAE